MDSINDDQSAIWETKTTNFASWGPAVLINLPLFIYILPLLFVLLELRLYKKNNIMQPFHKKKMQSTFNVYIARTNWVDPVLLQYYAEID